jgi:hypothetical protein
MACRAAARTRNVIDIEFTKLQSHNEPDILRALIQGLIDKADAEGVYEAVLLGYGLCGNSAAGLKGRGQKLVIPRAHDCCTVFLGSRKKFEEHFSERLSSQWSSHGYLERSSEYIGGTDIGKSIGYDRDYAALVEQYGEENAEYIWETLHPARNVGKDDRIYIDVSPFDGKRGGDYHYKRFEAAVMSEMSGAEPGNAPERRQNADNIAYMRQDSDIPASGSGSGSVKIQRIEGSSRLIDMLLEGKWGDDFLIVPPGMSIAPVYDMERVVVAVAVT